MKSEAGDENSRVEGSDSKKKDRRKERIDLEVYDQRSSNPTLSDKTQAVSGLKSASEGSTSSKDGGDAAELVVRLHGKGGEAGGDDARTSQGAKASSGSFADSLARELRENYNSDIVKRASVVLKDGGDGLIRLSLKPESLGAVKISLELADNRIAGHIIVESEEALRAFEKELASLEQAFRDGGFDGASLELSLSSGDSGTGSGAGRRDAAESMKPFYSERTVAGGYDAAVAREAGDGIVNTGARGNALVDMLA
jgi:flagellar hook-length control protein FliK